MAMYIMRLWKLRGTFLKVWWVSEIEMLPLLESDMQNCIFIYCIGHALTNPVGEEVILDRKFSSSFWHILIQPLSFIHPLQMFTRKYLCAPSSIYSWHEWQYAWTFAFAVLSDLVCQDVWFITSELFSEFKQVQKYWILFLILSILTLTLAV